MTTPAPYFIGCDDGFAEVKLAIEPNMLLRTPSLAKAGKASQVSLDGNASEIREYRTPEGLYVAGPLDQSDPTNFDEYPCSAMNRAIVTHALMRANLDPERPIYLCSGLPVKRFYRGAKPNADLISKKVANLLANNVTPQDGRTPPRIVKHQVIAEGIAAWMDLILQRDPATQRLSVRSDLVGKRTAIIDIGGQTTDVAVIHNWSMDFDRSTTIQVGMLALQREVRGALEDHLNTELSNGMVDEAISYGRVTAWGRSIDVNRIVVDAKQNTVNAIKAEVKRCLSRTADLHNVIFVGGTTYALHSQLQDWFPQQSIGANPAFANARGMQKYAEYAMANAQN